MSRIQPLPFPVHYTTVGVRCDNERLTALDADPAGFFWSTPSAPRRRDKKWLDEHAPGWTTDVQRKTVVTYHDLPVGQDDQADFLECDIYLVFTCPSHRQAWIDYRTRLDAAAHARQQHLDAILEAGGKPPTTCSECLETMETRRVQETARVAQFGFRYEKVEHVCTTCDTCCVDLSALNCLDAALEEAQRHVGLPAYGSRNWTEDVARERRRRRAAEPEVLIDVDLSSSSDEILAQFKVALAEHGYHPRPQFSPRVIGGKNALGDDDE